MMEAKEYRVRPLVDSKGKTLSRELFDENEQKQWVEDFDMFIAPPGSSRSVVLQQRRSEIMPFGEVAKKKLSGSFNGMQGSDSEVVMHLTRPGEILRTVATTQACQNFWAFKYAAADTYEEWVGYGTSRSTAITMDKDCNVIVVGLLTRRTPPPVREIYTKTGRGETNRIPLDWKRGPDQLWYTHIDTLPIVARDKVLVWVLPDSPVLDFMEAIAVSYTTGDFSANNTLSSVST